MKALWITPSGKYIYVPISHIDTVLNNLGIFGITKEYIDSVYDKHKEIKYVEGLAREEIIKELVRKGFIRIREYRIKWTITVYDLTKKVKDQLYTWALNQIEDKNTDIYARVDIYDTKTNKTRVFTLKKIAEDILLDEVKKKINKILEK